MIIILSKKNGYYIESLNILQGSITIVITSRKIKFIGGICRDGQSVFRSQRHIIYNLDDMWMVSPIYN